MPGTDLLSHTLAGAVSSALEGLTSGFGMEPGVSPPVWAPGKINAIYIMKPSENLLLLQGFAMGGPATSRTAD